MSQPILKKEGKGGSFPSCSDVWAPVVFIEENRSFKINDKIELPRGACYQ